LTAAWFLKIGCDMRQIPRTTLVLNALAIGALIVLSGCATDKTLMAAQDDVRTNAKGEEVVEKKGKHGYYALLPFAVLGDIALTPVYIGCYIYAVSTGHID